MGVPFACGLLSLAYGADANWDLFHTHLYNPYAWLNGRLDTDLAPAGMQSYFNPLLDVPYYWMSLHWFAPLVGFIMGLMHGLNFVLVLGIARLVIPALPDEDRHRLPLLLALAGCLTANFLSVLGNSMGDATTAVLVLAALWLVFRSWPAIQSLERGAWSPLFVAGTLAGLAAGLKLTNAVYALAFCLAFFTLPLARVKRLRVAFLFGVGVVAGLALTGGYWFWLMWERFHNPLFPMFSVLFPNPLTRPLGIGDPSWLPKGVLETLFWPFIFSWNSHRVGQAHLRQFIWALVYTLFWWWAIRTARRRFQERHPGHTEPRILYLIAAVMLSYFIWMKLFSIARYLVPIELLTPLLVFVLLRELVPYVKARRAAAWALTTASGVVLLGGVSTWGHEPWAKNMFRVESPAIADADKTTVFMVGNEASPTWLSVFLPKQLSFIGLAESFPESKYYAQRVREMVAERGGPIYAVVPGHRNLRADNVTRAQTWIERAELNHGETRCAMLDWVVGHLHLHAGVQHGVSADGGMSCRLEVLPEDMEDLGAENRASAAAYARLLVRYKYALDPASCTQYQAYVGATVYPYQWCQVEDTGKRAQEKTGG
ncbi:MAG: glycosyltransferase family 87 protein [Bacillota bacterium]